MRVRVIYKEKICIFRKNYVILHSNQLILDENIMKKRIFAIVCSALMLCTGNTWGEDISVVPALSSNSTPLSYGLFTVAYGGSAKFGSGKVEATSNGAEITLTFTTTKADLYIKTITLDAFSNGTHTSSDGTFSGDVFTAYDNKTSVVLTLQSSSGKKVSTKIADVVINTGTNIVETWNAFTVSAGTVGKTVKVNGLAYTSPVTLTTDGASISSGKLSLSNNKKLTFTSNGNIFFIGLLSADDKVLTSGMMQVGGTQLTTGAWTGTETSVEMTNKTGGGRSFSKLFVIADPIWAIRGDFNSWDAEGTEMTVTAGVASVTMNLAAQSRYEFKFKHGTNHYGNTGAIVSDVSGWAFATDQDNCTLYTGPAGEYTFTFNTTTNEVAVSYPATTHPDPNYVYFIPGGGWSNARIYCWEDGSDPLNEMSSWDGAPTITTTTTICGQSYYYCAAYFDRVKFRDDGTNQTENLVLEMGKYVDERTHPSAFADFTTYSITYDAGGGDGTMSPTTGICSGSDQTLPPCTYTKEAKVFAYWTADVAVTIGGTSVAAGDRIADKATLQSIAGDINLTAHWKDEPAYQRYIIGSCKIKDGTWKQGDNGNVGIYKYIPNGDASNIELSTDFTIEPESPSKGSYYYLSKDLAHLKDKSYWTTSSSSDRAITALDMKDATLQLHLGTLQAAKIELYGTTNTNSAGQIQLVAAGKQTKTIETGSAYNGKLYYTDLTQDAPYTGDEVSVVVGSQTQRFVVIVYVPAVKITYSANGGVGTMAEQVASIGETVQLRENEFTRSGYKFLGWTTDPAGTGELIADGTMYIMGDEDITLYAKWGEIIHTTITLNATGAYNTYTSSVVATNGEAMPEITTLPLRVGYVFDGYYDEPNGAGTKYYNGMGNGVSSWDKTDATAVLYAKWLTACELEPTLTSIIPVVTIWDGKEVDMGVVKLTCDYDPNGVEYDLLSVSPANPINGCHFEYFDEQIHLIGTPSVGNASTQNVNVTFTMTNDCDPASTYTITQQIRIYPASQKAKVAFIITGTENGAFDAYSTDNASSCNALVTYLNDYYDVTLVNGYATKNEADLETYYSNYDLLIVTDYLNTGKGYTNAIGTLIDKKPILSFEAYVANQSNWHIGSNPKDPSPKVQDMKVLCAGHAIFKNAKYNPSDASETVVVNPSDTSVHVLSSLSTAGDAKGLQGFTINEAPDFIFLATVRDANNQRDLIVCCERQVVFPARLLLYGINFYEMPNLSNAGKIIMRQMIDYLLVTNETKAADCSLVFDDNSGDHRWSNPANWAPGYNIIPTPYHPARIIAECHVDVDDAHAGSIKINKGRDEHGTPVDGKVIVRPNGGLTIAGLVATVNDTRYASPITIKAEDLLIEADASNNGAFVYGNKESDVRATVEYYSRGTDAKSANPVWQYMGIPFQVGHTALEMYQDAWMCRWESAGTLGGLWQWVNPNDVLVPFEGYCISQEASKTYTFSGKLNAPVTKTVGLDNRDEDGFAFAANSWTAPIKIQEMEDADFVNAERAIYIYHSGSYASWNTNKETIINTDESATTPAPGQYVVIPIHSSPYLGADSVIPAMQGFFVKTTATGAMLKLVYNRTVYDATYFKTSTQPMRAPRRLNTADEPEVMVLNVIGNSYGDRVHLLSRGDFSDEFEDGWDGRKLEGDTAAPYLAVVKEAGEMAVASIAEYEGRNLLFRAGEDIEYTFTFHYLGDDIYLYDRVTQQATLIRTGNTYTFSAVNKAPENRFLITANPPRTPTELNNVQGDNIPSATAQKFIYEGKLLIYYRGVIYDALGAPVKTGKEGAQ